MSGVLKSSTAAATAKLLQSRPTLCDPTDGSPQALPSLGFSRQEHWSGLPFPSPRRESEKWKWSRSLSVWLLYVRWEGSHWYLQEIPSKCRRIHLLLKCTWNILQDRPHLGSQIKTLKLTFLKFKKIEIASSIFSDHNAMRLDINYKEKTVRNTNTWRLNNMFLNNQQVTEEIKREIKKLLETNDNENTTIQSLCCCC